MGRGTIISGGADGLYRVRLDFHRGEKYSSEILRLETGIAALTVRIAAETDTAKKATLKLRKSSMKKRLDFLNSHPEDPEIVIWCADLTTDLSGEVGTAEIPGERGNVQILPGGGQGEGQLQRAIAGTPSGVYFNLSVLPGWQKWKPTYRHGTITSISGSLCSVALDHAVSSQQLLSVNQASSLTMVPIVYMDCNAEAFSVGDAVLVKFTGQDWSDPVVIGFKSSPKLCPELDTCTCYFTGVIVSKTDDNIFRVKEKDTDFIYTARRSDWVEWVAGDETPVLNLNYCDVEHVYDDTYLCPDTLLALINQARTDAGRDPLVFDSDLTEAARAHASYLKANCYDSEYGNCEGSFSDWWDKTDYVNATAFLDGTERSSYLAHVSRWAADEESVMAYWQTKSWLWDRLLNSTLQNAGISVTAGSGCVNITEKPSNEVYPNMNYNIYNVIMGDKPHNLLIVP